MHRPVEKNQQVLQNNDSNWESIHPPTIWEEKKIRELIVEKTEGATVSEEEPFSPDDVEEVEDVFIGGDVDVVPEGGGAAANAAEVSLFSNIVL